MSKTGSHEGINLVRPIKLSLLCQSLECLPNLKSTCLIYQIYMIISGVCPKMNKVQQSLYPTAKLEKLINMFRKGFSIQIETVDQVCGFHNVQLENWLKENCCICDCWKVSAQPWVVLDRICVSDHIYPNIIFVWNIFKTKGKNTKKKKNAKWGDITGRFNHIFSKFFQTLTHCWEFSPFWLF